MTTEEKITALNDGCGSYPLCDVDCPVYALPHEDCNFTDWTDEEINEAYDLMFPKVPTDTEDIINHPSHYCREGGMECLDEMELIFGREALKHFCICNAWKYRYRASAKNGDEDLKKSDFYMKKYKELSANG